MTYRQTTQEIKEIIRFVTKFYKNPLQEVEKVPHWSWTSLVILILVFSLITGLIRGLFSFTLFDLLIGVFIFPITSLICIFLASGFLYYAFVLFKSRTLNYKRLTTLVFICAIPTFTTYVLSLTSLFIQLIGVSLSLLLLAIGLTKRFFLDKKFVYILLSFFYVLFLSFWFIDHFNVKNNNRKTQIKNDLSI